MMKYAENGYAIMFYSVLISLLCTRCLHFKSPPTKNEQFQSFHIHVPMVPPLAPVTCSPKLDTRVLFLLYMAT